MSHKQVEAGEKVIRLQPTATIKDGKLHITAFNMTASGLGANRPVYLIDRVTFAFPDKAIPSEHMWQFALAEAKIKLGARIRGKREDREKDVTGRIEQYAAGPINVADLVKPAGKPKDTDLLAQALVSFGEGNTKAVKDIIGLMSDAGREQFAVAIEKLLAK